MLLVGGAASAQQPTAIVVAVRRGTATNGRQVRRVERQTFVDFSFRRGVTPP